MSAGGIRLESAPFLAMADAAMSAMDDAVSKPLRESAKWHFHMQVTFTESKQHAHWVHLSGCSYEDTWYEGLHQDHLPRAVYETNYRAKDLHHYRVIVLPIILKHVLKFVRLFAPG